MARAKRGPGEGHLCGDLINARSVPSAGCGGRQPTLKCHYGFRFATAVSPVFKFVRQEAIESFIVDFVCRERKLIIEVDGGQHSESMKDRERDATLAVADYQVLRFWNTDVLQNRNGVLKTILDALNRDN